MGEPAWTDSHLEVEAQLRPGHWVGLPFWSLGSLRMFRKIEESSIDLAWGPLSSQALSLVTLGAGLCQVKMVQGSGWS